MNVVSIRIAVALLFVVPFAVCADESAVYESLSDVSIGRVFFSPQERAQLDAARNGETVRRAPLTNTRQQPRADTDSAAGYFVDDAGRAWVYRNGNFVAVASTEDVKFPNKISVTRVDGQSDDKAEDDAAD